MKINDLTNEQREQIAVYRDRYFRWATSTDLADRERAEAAARRMAETGGVKIQRVVWCMSPEDCAVEYRQVWDSLRDSLRDSFSDSLSDSLRDSLMDSLGGSLWDSLMDSFRDSLMDSLMDSLGGSLLGSLRDSFRGSLRDSLGGSFRGSPWLCWYTYGVDVLGVSCSDQYKELLALHNEIAASCFAAWIAPGCIVLCERPATAEIVDGRLVGLTWRDNERAPTREG
jgi:hypothetical protein